MKTIFILNVLPNHYISKLVTYLKQIYEYENWIEFSILNE